MNIYQPVAVLTFDCCRKWVAPLPASSLAERAVPSLLEYPTNTPVSVSLIRSHVAGTSDASGFQLL